MSGKPDATPEQVADLTAYMRRQGYLQFDSTTGKIVDLTPSGRQWVRGMGINMPDDKSLLWLGLEALVEEVVTEGMERDAGRKTAAA